MKNKLWTFGDSFTFGCGCNELCTSDTYQKYKEYKKKGDDIWPNLLGRELGNIEVKNFGKNGASNDYILNSIIENYDLIDSNDYVVISKTFSSRIQIPIDDRWSNIMGIDELSEEVKISDTKTITKEQYETILNFQYLFSNNKLYKKRQDEWFEFIKNRLIDDKKIKKCILWEVENLIGTRDITTDTEGKINDGHFSYRGHSQFSQYIYSKIENKLF